MPAPLFAIPVIAGALVGVGFALKETFKMAREGLSPKEERKKALKGNQGAESSEPVEP